MYIADDDSIKKLVRFLTLLGILSTIFFGTLFKLNNLSYTQFTIGGLLYIACFFVRNNSLSSLLFLLATIFIIAYSFLFYGGISSPGIIWIGIIPLLTFILLDRHIAFKVIIGTFIILILCIYIGSLYQPFKITLTKKLYDIILLANILSVLF